MVTLLFIAIAIALISCWLAVRSLYAERLLPGSETYTTIILSAECINTSFFRAIVREMRRKHCAAVTTMGVVGDHIASTVYLRIPLWLVPLASQYGKITASDSLIKIITQKGLTAASHLRITHDRITPNTPSTHNLPNNSKGAGWVLNLRVAPRWHKEHEGFETSFFVVTHGQSAGKEEQAPLVATLKHHLAESTIAIDDVSEKTEEVSLWSYHVPSVRYGGYVLSAQEACDIVRAVCRMYEKDSTPLGSLLFGEIRLPRAGV